MNVLYRLGNIIGMDKSIAYSAGARIVSGFTGVASVFFISTFLTGIEQGFYYTFGSILALQVFFELGLTGIMTQYVAHEASHLHLSDNMKYKGDSRYLSRLSSLVHFCTKWYSVLAIIVFIFLFTAGFVYFSKYGDTQASDVEWKMPWLLICIGTALKLFTSPFSSILNGLGFVKQIAKITFWQQIIIPFFSWLGLACGLKLYVTGVGYVLSIVVWIVVIYKEQFLDLIRNLWCTNLNEKVSYMEEIFPYQWRIALSWMSGYFIFQFFNPVLFATEGAVVAGQMGMTMTVLSAIQSLSFSWLNTKIPLYSKLIALGDYVNLDKIFNKTLAQMVTIATGLLCIFLIIVCLLKFTHLEFRGNIFGDRFLDLIPMIIMMVPVLTQQFVNSWATYLRCHKKEPFLLLSIITGIACMLSTLLLGRKFGLYGITIGYCFIQFIAVPWAYIIYRNKKNEWHYEK